MKNFPKFFFTYNHRIYKKGVNFSQKFFLINRGDCPPYTGQNDRRGGGIPVGNPWGGGYLSPFRGEVCG